MSIPFDLSAAELSALLCSKVCHDLVSPIGAMSMSLEMLDEPGAADDAMELVRKSAVSATATLAFCRLAYGASGSVGASIDTGDAESVVADYFAGERAEVTWKVPRMILPKNRVKLLLNLIEIATTAIPRGGEVTVTAEGEGEAAGFTLDAVGRRARVPVVFDEMLQGDLPMDGVSATNVQTYYTMLLANECGMKLDADLRDEGVLFTAR